MVIPITISLPPSHLVSLFIRYSFVACYDLMFLNEHVDMSNVIIDYDALKGIFNVMIYLFDFYSDYTSPVYKYIIIIIIIHFYYCWDDKADWQLILTSI